MYANLKPDYGNSGPNTNAFNTQGIDSSAGALPTAPDPLGGGPFGYDAATISGYGAARINKIQIGDITKPAGKHADVIFKYVETTGVGGIDTGTSLARANSTEIKTRFKANIDAGGPDDLINNILESYYNNGNLLGSLSEAKIFGDNFFNNLTKFKNTTGAAPANNEKDYTPANPANPDTNIKLMDFLKI